MKITIFLILSISTLIASCNNTNSEEGLENKKGDTVSLFQEKPSDSVSQIKNITPYIKEVNYNSIRFTVSSPGTAKDNNFTISPAGLSVVNDPDIVSIIGLVYDVVIDDIDGDDSPEVAVITKSGNMGNAYIFSANNNRSFGRVNFPELSDQIQLNGYRGFDEFNFVEGSFIRRFPLFDGENKTGKMRQLQYKLKAGEAMKQLVFSRSVEF